MLFRSVTFCFCPNIKAAGYPEIVIKSKWEEWRAGWFLVEFPAPSPLFDEPTEVVTDQPSWTRLSCQDEELGTAVVRFKLLRDRKVMAPALLAHFLRHRIAPLQKRPHPVWDYQGPADPSRLDGEDMSHKQVRETVAKIFRAKMMTKMPPRVSLGGPGEGCNPGQHAEVLPMGPGGPRRPQAPEGENQEGQASL